MRFPNSQEDPAVLQDVQRGREIPERRKDDNDLGPDAPQLFEKPPGVVDVLDGMGAQDGSELAVPKRQMVDIPDPDETGDVGVANDIGVDTPSISLAAADIQIPGLPAQNPSFKNLVAYKMDNPG